MRKTFIKFLSLLTVFTLGATNALADVTFNEAGKPTGTIDVSNVWAFGGILLTALASIIVLRWIIGFVKRG
mgnify:FL=1|jgi:hypothetical protein